MEEKLIMRVSTIFSIVGFALITPVANGQVLASNTCPADAPIEVTVPALIPSVGGQAVALVTNKGPKPITAIFLTWRVTDSNGAFYNASSTIDFAPSGVTFDQNQKSQTDATISVAEGRTVKTVEITCSAVLFKGPDGWGDYKSAEVQHLRAVRQGIAAERKRLLAVLAKDGATRLTEELNRNVLK